MFPPVNEKSPLDDPRATKIDAVPPCFMHAAYQKMSLRASAHTGVAISRNVHTPQPSVTGRTRDSLPIENPAPRPCSAVFAVPTHTCLGSLTGYPDVLFSSSLLHIPAIIAPKAEVCQPTNCSLSGRCPNAKCRMLNAELRYLLRKL